MRHPLRRVTGRAVIALAFALLAACARQDAAPPPYFPPPVGDEFSVMSYNLRMYRYTDRDEDGQEDDFKPESEIGPLLEMIRRANPDVLVLQELGDTATMNDLRDRLRTAGLDYPHADHLNLPESYVTLGLLSRFPIVARESVTNLFYSIQGRSFPVLRGFQQVDLATGPGTTVRVVNVHLKSKMFHEAGQTEMRRNEARLLATELRKLERTMAGRPVLVCGDFNDTYNSAAMRELLDQDNLSIEALPLEDPHGDRWSHYFRREDSYARIDYMLVNPVMKRRWVQEKSGIIRDPLTYQASDHRPLYGVFRAKD